MPRLQLSLAITSNPRTWPIIDGRVKTDGIDFAKTVLGPAEMFWRQLLSPSSTSRKCRCRSL